MARDPYDNNKAYQTSAVASTHVSWRRRWLCE